MTAKRSRSQINTVTNSLVYESKQNQMKKFEYKVVGSKLIGNEVHQNLYIFKANHIA